MELKNHIQLCAVTMMAQLKIFNKIELYGHNEYDFIYGMNEKHASIKRMFKEIKRLWHKK
tara:strand:- start:316 stop:495 length:180 start_codon:yes stop_codon:yes gene_type:complete